MTITSTTRVRVWDLPTRAFHWALLLAVVGAVASAKAGMMDWHPRFGYAVFALLAFRLLWGLVGGRWSRFVSFVRGPGTLWRYLRGTAGAGERLDVGHSPLGALSVLALLAVLAAQVGTGLVSDDEIAFTGPLNVLVSTDTALSATSWHRGWGQWLLLGLVGLHVAAIVAYALRGRRLLPAMWHGDKTLPADTPPSADGAAQRFLAVLLLAACSGGVWWVVTSVG
jgi:cytochrome b